MDIGTIIVLTVILPVIFIGGIGLYFSAITVRNRRNQDNLLYPEF